MAKAFALQASKQALLLLCDFGSDIAGFANIMVTVTVNIFALDAALGAALAAQEQVFSVEAAHGLFPVADLGFDMIEVLRSGKDGLIKIAFIQISIGGKIKWREIARFHIDLILFVFNVSRLLRELDSHSSLE